ncbi:MAG: hypothetical protein ACSLFQ_08085 [Thermoanaerobaculia bacterium]
MHRQNLGHMLLAANLIDEVQMSIALEEQKRTGRRFGSSLVDLKFIDENVLAAFLSKQIDVPCISLLNIDIPKKVLRRLPAKIARDCHAVPIRIDGDRLQVAMADPTDIDTIRTIEAATGMIAVPMIAPQSSIDKMIEHLFPEQSVEDGDNTMASIPHPENMASASDPMFMDLIEEIENADIDNRLAKIEDRLDEIWMLLEKVLRKIEAGDVIRERISARHNE